MSGSPVLLFVPVLAVLATWRWRYDLAAPASIFGIVWLVAITGAQVAPFDKPAWDLRMWLVATLPPALLVAGALAGAGRAPIKRPPLGLRVAAGVTIQLQVLLAAAVLVGGAVLVYEFIVVGGIPLLSANGDELRFRLVFNPFLHLVTRLVPIAGILAAIAAVAARGRDRVGYLLTVVLALALMGAQSARLEVVLIAATVALAMFLGVRLSPKAWLAIGAIGVLTVGFSSWLFFHRASEHPNMPFETYLFDELVTSRPAALAWTIPVQISTSSGLYVLNALVESDALQQAPGSGLYSFHGLDRVLPAKDSQAVAQQVAGPLVVSTFLADIYGDFGVVGASLWCLLCGVIYGGIYRMAVGRRSLANVVLYAYVGFWLAFFIYVNIWTYFIYWALDGVLLWVGASLVERGEWSLGQVRFDLHRPILMIRAPSEE